MGWNEIIDKVLSAVDVASDLVSKNNAVQKQVGKDVTSKIKVGNEVVKYAITTKKVGTTVTGVTALASAAGGLQVAATSGAGIATGLSAAGGVVGGTMAAGPAVLAVGPAAIVSKIMNETLFKDEKNISKDEKKARSAARTATGLGAAAGVVSAGTATVAGGASGAAIMSTLATVGGAVGGSAIAGTVVLAAAPAVVTVGIGYGIYKLFGGSKKSKIKKV